MTIKFTLMSPSVLFTNAIICDRRLLSKTSYVVDFLPLKFPFLNSLFDSVSFDKHDISWYLLVSFITYCINGYNNRFHPQLFLTTPNRTKKWISENNGLPPTQTSSYKILLIPGYMLLWKLHWTTGLHTHNLKIISCLRTFKQKVSYYYKIYNSILYKP